MSVFCTNCKRPYPEEGAPYRCPKCGGLFDLTPWDFDPAQVDRSKPGIWRYRHTFSGLPANFPAVSLGEGSTPLVWSTAFGRQIAFKCESLNPTGSFKDRGTTVIATFLHSRGVTEALEDSSGNAGASFAAYAARAGLKAGIYIPAAASGPKRKQIEFYGAQIHPIPGSRADVTRALEKAVGQDFILTAPAYASHAWLPFNLPGYATAAYEIYEQVGAAPSAVIVPAGQGGLWLGLARGFDALKRAGLVKSLPKIIGVQARACSPLWVLTTAGPSALGFVTEGQTLAEGVKVRNPLRAGTILEICDQGYGAFLPVDEADILRGRDELAKRGLYVEPTSALVWSALEQVVAQLPDPLAVVLTGSGYKYAAKA
ncbi:MAG: pyridoxal-phosphate dependent enzyme [Chloroflexi bacterium]|nr:MAG: pyridoxal-phosphate dependent enzyme [Chloroflexota bacterium]